ncbi:hypothetical protein [Microbacterium sp. A94]|uniref:hypothetical protein n=1 Tax=Microbacterium sp. A94 TaxID=3450717 RepID=UPI003F442E88
MVETLAPFEDIAPWPPTRHTPPLSAGFRSLFDPYARAFGIIWRQAFGYDLEAWQIELIRAILEVFPDGHPRAGELRWMQAVVSLARQNGKTEIAAALGLWRLLHRAGALVIGIASSAEQAGLVYRRTMRAIVGNPSLARRFDGLTETRGIRALDGGRYELKAARSAALQGLPIDLGLVDELHLLKRELWGDLVSGTGGRVDCLVVGITTAGDAESELLIDLYKLGDKSIANDGEGRVGFWVWEAPEARVPEDDETLGRWLAMANPSIASGRRDLENLISLVRSKPEPDAIRYHLNQFLAASRAPFLPFDKWFAARRLDGEPFPTSRPIFTFDASPGLGYVAVTATARDENGVLHTELVASLVSPSLDDLVRLALKLSAHAPLRYALDGYRLRALGDELKRRGLPVYIGTGSDALQSAALLYRLVASGMLKHAGDDLLSQQMPRAIRKNVGESFRISRADSSTEIDAVCATALGVLVAEMTPDSGIQVF